MEDHRCDDACCVCHERSCTVQETIRCVECSRLCRSTDCYNRHKAMRFCELVSIYLVILKVCNYFLLSMLSCIYFFPLLSIGISMQNMLQSDKAERLPSRITSLWYGKMPFMRENDNFRRTFMFLKEKTGQATFRKAYLFRLRN